MAEGRPVAAESANMTEFGSKRFHDKIEQHHHEPQHEPSQRHGSFDSTPSFASRPTFSLPLRDSKAHDADSSKIEQKREKKGGFFNLRHKVSLLHSKPTHIIEIPEASKPIRSSIESSHKRYVPIQRHLNRTAANDSPDSLPLEQLFQTLPNELQSQVIQNLSLSDVLNLRIASKTWHSLVTQHEGPIVRHHLQHSIPLYARRLYPVNDNSELNFHYICSIWHRLHVAAKLAYMISEWVTKDIYLRRDEAQRLAFAPQHESMRRRLIPLVFTIFHFFETYRKLHLQYVEKHGHGLKRDAYTVNPIEKEIMDMYDDETLLRVHEAFPLVIASFCRRLRPPTYVGRFERSLRGYTREKPSDDVHVAILCIGGMRQVERLWEIKGYNARRTAVDNWFNSVSKDGSVDPPPKTRRSLMSFGRKKSTSGESREGHRESHRGSFSSLHRTRSPSGSMDGHDMAFESDWIFNTSLSAGVPMGSLTREQARDILDDLPVLNQIWVTTAEALILDRQIVRTGDIKRNQQVLLDLIQEGSLDDRDEWSHGRKLHDSVRPPPNATLDDDAD